MAAATVVLTAIGGWALSGRIPGDMRPADFAFRLFAPWQAVLGVSMAMLLVTHAPRRGGVNLASGAQRSSGSAR